jgi:hypothetical protein
VCDRKAVKELFNIASIKLRAGGDSNKVLLSQVLRYMKKNAVMRKATLLIRSQRATWLIWVLLLMEWRTG